MNNSFRLGSAFGIGIFVHWTFALLPLWVVTVMLSGGFGFAAALGSVVFIFAVFGCIVLHELGHSLAARRYGIPTRSITLLPIGGVAELERMPTDPKQELVIAVAGPLVNVFIAGFLLIIGYAFGFVSNLTGFGSTAALGSLGGIIGSLIYANVFLVLFNMIPAFPMDGGRVFRALLAMKKGYVPATEIAAALGKVLAVVIGAMGVFYLHQPFLAILAVFVWFAGESERRQARIMQQHFPRSYASTADGLTEVEILPPDAPAARKFVVKWPR